jgi:small conductance mechanosensitive channel
VLGVQMTAIYVGFCVFAVAATFMSLPILRDVGAGYVILAEDQFAPGDQVKIGDLVGTVESMTLRQTTIRDAQNPEVVHVVANREITRLTTRRERTEPQRPIATPPAQAKSDRPPATESK